MWRRVSLLSVSIVVLAAGDARAQCLVRVVVRLADGAPLSAGTVCLDGPDYKQPLQTTTDANGRYQFENVKPGIRVRIVAPHGSRPVAQCFGFTLVTLRVETVDLKEPRLSNSDDRPEPRSAVLIEAAQWEKPRLRFH